MGYFVKKTLTGYREVSGGYSDPDAEYYIESIAEYERDIKNFRRAEKEAMDAKANAAKLKLDYETAINKRSYDMIYKMQEYEAELNKRAAEQAEELRQEVKDRDDIIISLKDALSRARGIASNEKDLNANLIRIMTERANQARGITPKKESDGYIVLSTTEWKEKYTEDEWDTEEHEVEYAEKREAAIQQGYLKVNRKEADVWKSVLQTPYDSSLLLEHIRDRIEYDLLKGGVLYDIGCQQMAEIIYRGDYMEFVSDDGIPENGLYNWRYRANFREGFWEMEIFTTKSLRVPEHRRPPRWMKGQKNGRKKAAEAETVSAGADS